MVTPQSSVRGKTDAKGGATGVLKGSCDATSWQVIDLATCHPRCPPHRTRIELKMRAPHLPPRSTPLLPLPGSRVGSAAAFNSTVRTAASALAERWSPRRVTTTASSQTTRTQHSAPTAQHTKADVNVKWW